MIKLRKTLISAALLGTLTAGLIQPAAAAFDKTRFVADLGMAYFAFHHFVVKPYENKEFETVAPHHKKAMVKAGLAMLFAVYEVKHASKIAKNSKDPTLMKLSMELNKLTAVFGTMGSKFKKGNVADGDYKSLTDTFGAVSGSVGSAGYDVKDKETKIPGISDTSTMQKAG